MLPQPPCVSGFIDCDPGNTRRPGITIPPYQSSDGSLTIPPYNSSDGSLTIPPYQSSDRSFNVPPYNSSDGSLTIPPYQSSDGSLTIPSLTGPNRSGIGSSPSAGSNDLFAVYTVTLRNPLQNPLKGLSLQHGPVPFGATFDPVRSEKSCSLLQKIVGCNQNIGPGETKTFPIIYKIMNPAFCRISPVLQSIKTMYANATGGTPPASATVQCAVMRGDELDRELATRKALEDAKERALRDPRSVYTIGLKNLSSKALKDLTVTHGPVPQGLSFDPTRSDARCKVSGANVICTQDLAGKKSKEFQITYKVTDGSKCETTPTLQSVQTSEKASNIASKVLCVNAENTLDSAGSSNVESPPQKTKAFIAEYFVTLKNRSSKVQNGLLLNHGPVPSEALFSPALSSKTCSKAGENVSCKQALHGNEQKTFKISYKVDSPEDCESFATLKTVNVTNETEADVPPVSAWVQCTTRRSDTLGSVEDPSVTSLDQRYFGDISLPETGHNNQYYLSVSESDVITVPQKRNSEVSYDAFFMMAGLSILLIGLAAIMKLPQKSGLKTALYARF